MRGHIDVPAGRLEAVRAAAPEHMRRSRAEAGCIRFDLREDPAMPGRFLVDEAFADTAAFVAHTARARASAWGRITAGLARHLDVQDHDG